MRVDNIIQLFENTNLQSKEEIIVATMINCKNTIKKLGLAKNVNNEKLINLFESISGINISNQSNSSEVFNNEHIVKIEDYHNNVYAYLKNVVNLMENHVPFGSMINNDSDIKNFTTDVEKCIADLEKINDFQKFSGLNEMILKTKLFAMKPIYVLGVNIFDIVKIKELVNFKLLYSIIYNKSNKQLMFVGDNVVMVYDIKTDKLGEAHTIIEDLPIIKVKPENYMIVIKEEISNNLVELYKNISSKSNKFTDNLYGDVKRIQHQQQVNEQKKKNNSVVRN